LECPSVELGVGFVVTKDNYTEVRQAAKLTREAGADHFRISAVSQPDDAEYFEDFEDAAFHECREATLESTGVFDPGSKPFVVHNNFSARVADLHLKNPNYTRCPYQGFTTYIGADLSLYRCCVLAYTKRGLVGSLEADPFYQLWEDHAREWKTFDATGCPRCQFNDRNRTINAALDRTPTHGNFV
jgi:MoaA/NifB/PqqE/SkfB family radical SAM enzyme